MLYEIWYQVSRTIFPFISLKHHNDMLNQYDDHIEFLESELDKWEEDAEYLDGVARMDNEGMISPDQWRNHG